MDDKNDQADWDYKPTAGTTVAERPPAPALSASKNKQPPSSDSMTWTASEYIEHDRGIGWYMLLILATIAIAAIFYLMTKDYFTVGVIVVLGIIVSVWVGRKPRQIQYQITSLGVQVGEKPYKYSQFRSFSIIREDAISSIEFIPIKRFLLPLSVFFGPGDEERIVDIIGQHLPYQEKKMDPIDRLSRRLRF